ncbi:MAG: hypothetical protein VBE63_13310, partial [Lamprobacter sp.]|nr:hypothetical protein [Lamprobacter sp.]
MTSISEGSTTHREERNDRKHDEGTLLAREYAKSAITEQGFVPRDRSLDNTLQLCDGPFLR